MFSNRIVSGSFACLLAVTLNSACEMKDPVKSTHPSPNPNYPAGATQPEGGSGTVRDQLPASGAAATGGGVTSSNTSAASGAVSNPDHVQGTPPGPEAPTSAQPQVPGTTAPSPAPTAPEARK